MADEHLATRHAEAGGDVPAPHLPHGSIWPFWMAIAIAVVGLGVIFLDTSLAIIALGIVLLAIVLVGWVREDFQWWTTNTGTGPGMARAGTLLFISSEVFIFGALFSTYFTFQRMAEHWPDITIHGGHFPLPIGTTAIFTLFLFSSSYTIHQAEKHIQAGNKKAFNNWWLATIILGAIFLTGQVLEYVNLIAEGHTLGSSQFMTTFYMLTGTHGLHVFGGLIALSIAYVRSVNGNFDEHRHAYPGATAMYWHFVDLVWVFVFGVLYLIPKYVLGA